MIDTLQRAFLNPLVRITPTCRYFPTKRARGKPKQMSAGAKKTKHKKKPSADKHAVAPEQAGDNCSAGGIKITSKEMDGSKSTSYVCNVPTKTATPAGTAQAVPESKVPPLSIPSHHKTNSGE